MLYFPVIAVLLALLYAPVAHAGATAAGSQKTPQLLKIVKHVKFHNPVDCTAGRDCWVLNYPDVGPDNDGLATDTACAARTYEGHKGVDIAIDGRAAMMRGVDVLAARGGTVLRVRDGEDDHFPLTQDQLAKIKADKKECGNAVLIDHGDGWQAMYCHMKRGSIIVTPDQTVKAGDRIGEVGASGMTEFPHLHFGLTKDGIVIDPLTGRDIKEPCNASGTGTSLFLKSDGIAYEPLAFMKSGFHNAAVRLDEIDNGLPQTSRMENTANALVFYSVMLGVHQGDTIAATITGPDGKIFAQSHSRIEKNRARHMVFIGRNIPKDAPLQSGIYKAAIDVTRAAGGKEPLKFSERKTIEITNAQ